MKYLFLILYSFSLIHAETSFCSNKKDYEMYLATYKSHELLVNSIQKNKGKDKQKLFMETFQANYYGLLYNECLAKVKDKELNTLLSSTL